MTSPRPPAHNASQTMPEPPNKLLARRNPYDLAAALLLIALAAFALATFRDYSISNDEEVQHRYGELILAYYASGFADRALFEFKNLYLYGGLFDVTAILIARALAADVIVVRHLLCAFIGIGGIAATWAAARLIAGPRAGLLAALALAVCGVWIGGLFNHSKDVPFAAAMMASVYFLLRAARDLPRPRGRDTIGFGLTAGAALGIRPLGLLLAFYLIVAIGMRAPRLSNAATAGHFVSASLLRFASAALLAYAIMLVAWPWSALSPLNPLRGLLQLSDFHYPIKTLLAGTTYLMAEVPRWYVPAYLAIKLPLALWAGVALALLVAALRLRAAAGADRRLAQETLFVATVAVVPVLAEVIAHGPAFSGMRHFLFVVPPLAVLAGVGFDAALEFARARSRALALAAGAAVALGLAYPASVLFRLHPYEYLFFNPLVGGLPGASQRYDIDYWVNVMHDAVGELERVLDREGRAPRRYFVAVCGERFAFDYEARRRGRLVWATDDDPADFFIAPTHQDCHNAIDGRVIATIERLGTPIGVVKDRRHLVGSPSRR